MTTTFDINKSMQNIKTQAQHLRQCAGEMRKAAIELRKAAVLSRNEKESKELTNTFVYTNNYIPLNQS